MICEGEYINGKRNGKGKKYDYKDDKLSFEGEYLNGKIWNGKGYNINGNIEFEIKEGKGYIKEFDYNGELIFEGEYLNGLRNGKGKEFDSKGEIKFEGEYLDGKIWNGNGKDLELLNLAEFKGEYFHGKRWNGILQYPNGTKYEIKEGKMFKINN